MMDPSGLVLIEGASLKIFRGSCMDSSILRGILMYTIIAVKTRKFGAYLRFAGSWAGQLAVGLISISYRTIQEDAMIDTPHVNMAVKTICHACYHVTKIAWHATGRVVTSEWHATLVPNEPIQTHLPPAVRVLRGWLAKPRTADMSATTAHARSAQAPTLMTAWNVLFIMSWSTLPMRTQTSASIATMMTIRYPHVVRRTLRVRDWTSLSRMSSTTHRCVSVIQESGWIMEGAAAALMVVLIAP